MIYYSISMQACMSLPIYSNIFDLHFMQCHPDYRNWGEEISNDMRPVTVWKAS